MKNRIEIYFISVPDENDLYEFYTDFEEAREKAKSLSEEGEDYVDVYKLTEGECQTIDENDAVISFFNGKVL